MGKPIRSSNAGLKGDAIPDSRLHGGGGSEDCPDSLRGLHLNEVPCEELPPNVWNFLTADRTDEGIREAQCGAGTGRVGRSELEGRMAERRDGLNAGMQPWEAPDVLKEAAANLPRGMRPKFINEARAKRGEAGSRGFEIYKGENGDPIRVGDLVLAAMPEDNAKARNAHYQKRAREIEGVKDVDRARSGNKFARQGVDFSENGTGISPEKYEAYVDTEDAQPGSFDRDSDELVA